MKMRPIDTLNSPAGKTVELKPDSYHIMLTDIIKSLKQGVTLLTLTIESADKQRQSVQVKAQERVAAMMENNTTT